MSHKQTYFLTKLIRQKNGLINLRERFGDLKISIYGHMENYINHLFDDLMARRFKDVISFSIDGISYSISSQKNTGFYNLILNSLKDYNWTLNKYQVELEEYNKYDKSISRLNDVFKTKKDLILQNAEIIEDMKYFLAILKIKSEDFFNQTTVFYKVFQMIYKPQGKFHLITEKGRYIHYLRKKYNITITDSDNLFFRVNKNVFDCLHHEDLDNLIVQRNDCKRKMQKLDAQLSSEKFMVISKLLGFDLRNLCIEKVLKKYNSIDDKNTLMARFLFYIIISMKLDNISIMYNDCCKQISNVQQINNFSRMEGKITDYEDKMSIFVYENIKFLSNIKA